MLAAVTVSGMKTRPVMKKGCRPVSRVSRVTFLKRTALYTFVCKGGQAAQAKKSDLRPKGATGGSGQNV